MKEVISAFFKSTKGKVITGASGVGVTAAVVALVVLMNQGFRTIVVDSLNGTSKVSNSSQSIEAFVGQHLKDGDDVRVSPSSDLTLFVDQDKYIYAEENAHFWLEAKGKIGDTRTSIKQDAGSVLYRVDSVLTANEYFNVNSSNASMSVRGTVFRITCEAEAADKYTKIEVFEGSVYVEAKMENGDATGESRILNAGEMAIIRSNDEISEFLEDEEHNVVRLIEYNSLPQGTARNLGTIIDSGRDVGITKELLFDYVAITEHQFVVSDESVDPTHVLSGNLVEICTVCGIEKETEIPPLSEGEEAHEIITEEVVGTCDNPGYRIVKCNDCGEEIERIPLGEKKEHNFGEYKVTKKATEDEEGEKVAVCADCGEKKIVKIDKLKPIVKPTETVLVTPTPTVSVNDVAKVSPSPSASVNPVVAPTVTPSATPTSEPKKSSSSSDDPCANGHNYVLKDTVDSTCSATGSKNYECTRCKEKKSDTIAKKDHTINDGQAPSSVIDPTCLKDGKLIYDCVVCGAAVEKPGASATGHDFSAAGVVYFINDSGHATRCINYENNVQCDEYGSLVAHTLDRTAVNDNLVYSTDADYHWNRCTKCRMVNISDEMQINKTAHDNQYVQSLGQHKLQCTICKREVRGTEARCSSTSTGYEFDSNDHWKICDVCGGRVEERAHDFPDGSNICSICNNEIVR